MNKAPTFEEFWNAYGLKRDRIAAERSWNKLNTKDKRAAIMGISAYKQDCEQRGISRMYGQGYINHRRWEDDFCASEANCPMEALKRFRFSTYSFDLLMSCAIVLPIV